jgi:uncharacterized protein with LGFP repeats
VSGSTAATWLAYGGAGGTLGWPTAEATCSTSGTCSQAFQYGYITTSPTGGTRAIWGGFAAYWANAGGLSGRLGAALSDVVYDATAGHTGWRQRFTGGLVAQAAGGSPVTVTPAYEAGWAAAGGVAGWLGWPTAEQTCTTGNCAQSFSTGVLSSSPTYGVHAIVGSFSGWWTSAGGLSVLGPALTDLRFDAGSGGGWIQHFAGGVAAQPRGGSVVLTSGAIQSTWYSWGAAQSWIGWPTANVSCIAQSCGEAFQAGAMTSDPTYGVRALVGGIGTFWGQGGLSTYGVATSDTTYSSASGGGWKQTVTAGLIAQSRATAPVLVPTGDILRTWMYYGAEATWLGWPIGSQTCSAGTCTQTFQGGSATSSSSGVVFTPR